jgi:hypothetical protein
MNRKQAKNSGSKFFTTAKPCGKGHMAERYTSTGNCVACQKLQRYGVNNQLATEGFVLVSLHVHPDDLPTLRIIAADLLNARRVASFALAEIAESRRRMTAGEDQKNPRYDERGNDLGV